MRREPGEKISGCESANPFPKEDMFIGGPSIEMEASYIGRLDLELLLAFEVVV